MRWTEQIISAHKRTLALRPADRREKLIAHWESYRRDGTSEPAVGIALQLAGKGSANEVELGFYVLMDLALTDPSMQRHVSQLAKHKSATVRRSLAFYLSPDLPPEFRRSVYKVLLGDKAASVRRKTIEDIGMCDFRTMLPDLHALRSREQSDKVIQSLRFWLPLLEAGYRVDPSPHPGGFEVTALIKPGIASKTVAASGPGDPRILAAVEELRRSP